MIFDYPNILIGAEKRRQSDWTGQQVLVAIRAAPTDVNELRSRRKNQTAEEPAKAPAACVHASTSSTPRIQNVHRERPIPAGNSSVGIPTIACRIAFSKRSHTATPVPEGSKAHSHQKRARCPALAALVRRTAADVTKAPCMFAVGSATSSPRQPLWSETRVGRRESSFLEP